MEVMAEQNLHDNTIMRELYEASLNGCFSTLNTLIQKDPIVLSRVSLCPEFIETPLHIASLLGHLEFCKVLLEKKPSLAIEVDLEGRAPLHLASAEGHTEVVKALLVTNSETCSVRDKDGMLPLHFAVMRGRLGAIEALIGARPESIEERIESDDSTVLHLCIQYNHLEALKLLVELVRGDDQFLCAQDKDGNTILHLAVRRRQTKTIKYLLSLSELSPALNVLNGAGLTALEQPLPSPPEGIAVHTQQSNDPSAESSPSSYIESIIIRVERLCKKYLISQKNWMDDKQLMVAATVIATMTFQTAVTPPGGTWGQDSTDGGYDCTTYGFCEAGTAIVGYAWSPDYFKFIFFNSTSFFSSVCVLLIVISGFPLDNKVTLWILSFLMVSAVTCMLFTYMWALGLTSPNHIYYRIRSLGYVLVGTWAFLILLICFIQVIRFIFWRRSRRMKQRNLTNAQVNEYITSAPSDAAT